VAAGSRLGSVGADRYQLQIAAGLVGEREGQAAGEQHRVGDHDTNVRLPALISTPAISGEAMPPNRPQPIASAVPLPRTG
jgi:hypothetical protein